MAVEVRDNIFREYDIRGVFEEELTIELAGLLGTAYGAFLRDKVGKTDGLIVTVGRDVRLSSAEIKDALIEGIIAAGIDVWDIGECPTPLQYFSLYHLKKGNGDLLDGGIMITGSHNPANYNGFKVSIGRETIHGSEIQELKGYMKRIASEGPVAPKSRGSLKETPLIPEYIDFHREGFKERLPSAGLAKPVKVVLDSGNGTGGLVAPELLRTLGAEVVELYCDVDGRFPNHHPDPTVAENLTDLIAKVRETGADFGVGYDGDSDRIGLVDENGRVIYGDEIMIIFARAILEENPSATIVGEVKCSQIMYDEITRLGGNAVMWKTGHSLIKSKMVELKAAMAGEMSGHIFFADRYLGFDDAVYASARLLEILVKKREKDPAFKFSSLLAGLPSSVVTPEYRVESSDDDKFKVIEEVKELVGKEVGEGSNIRDLIDIDGLRVVFNGGWALVRASNTQPVLVMRFEADDEKLLEEYKGFMRDHLRRARPTLEVSF